MATTKSNDRTPDVHVWNPRDHATGFRLDSLKSQWRKACFSVTALPPDADHPRERRVRVHRQGAPSLKRYARAKADAGESFATRWLANKAMNTSKPPLGVGRTHGKKKGDSGAKKKG